MTSRTPGSTAPVRDLSEIVKAYDVRGTVPDQLDAEVCRALGAAFADIVVVPEAAAPTGADEASGPGSRPRTVVGHDMRESGPGLVEAFTEGLVSRGVDVVHIGLCSTDGLYFASGTLDAPGAMFTASHNPAQYNGIKLCRSGARPVGAASGLVQVRELAARLLGRDTLSPGPTGTSVTGLDDSTTSGPATSSPPRDTAALRLGTVSEQDLLAEYAAFLRDLVDVSAVRPLRVVVDAGNGMGGYTVPAVLGTAAGLPALPLDIVPLYFDLDGSFPNHEANPLEPANLVDLQAAVVEHGADLGLAFDGDADRCFVVDERGLPVSPSAVTALVGLREVAREQAAGRAPTVIHNLITSQVVPEMLGAAGAHVVRSRVGHSFIKAQMAEHDAVFGGEHSAHYYFRDFFFADTGMLAALHVIAALGEQDQPLSGLVAALQPYAASGEINTRLTSPEGAAEAVVRVVEALAQDDEPVTVDYLDGLTVSHWSTEPRWWLSLRASNTEPLVRLNVEAADPAVMAEVRDRVLALVRG